ncbi:hypothetical protein NKG05_27085 [Oerskovia sp. M15]
MLVEDRVLGNSIEPVRAQKEVLYSVVPFGLLLKYILDPTLRRRLQLAKDRGDAVNPLKYSRDASLKRRVVIEAMTQNFRRKYKKYYPEPTSTGY